MFDFLVFFFQAEDGIRDRDVTGVQTCAMPALAWEAGPMQRATTLRTRTAAAEALGGAPPHLYFVVSAVFHYLGPAFAVLLFARVGVLGVAWLRIASAALIFAAWRRPWRTFARLDRSGRRLLLGWGAVLAVMNACFYI